MKIMYMDTDTMVLDRTTKEPITKEELAVLLNDLNFDMIVASNNSGKQIAELKWEIERLKKRLKETDRIIDNIKREHFSRTFLGHSHGEYIRSIDLILQDYEKVVKKYDNR